MPTRANDNKIQVLGPSTHVGSKSAPQPPLPHPGEPLSTLGGLWRAFTKGVHDSKHTYLFQTRAQLDTPTAPLITQGNNNNNDKYRWAGEMAY